MNGDLAHSVPNPEKPNDGLHVPNANTQENHARTGYGNGLTPVEKSKAASAGRESFSPGTVRAGRDNRRFTGQVGIGSRGNRPSLRHHKSTPHTRYVESPRTSPRRSVPYATKGGEPGITSGTSYGALLMHEGFPKGRVRGIPYESSCASRGYVPLPGDKRAPGANRFRTPPQGPRPSSARGRITASESPTRLLRGATEKAQGPTTRRHAVEYPPRRKDALPEEIHTQRIVSGPTHPPGRGSESRDRAGPRQALAQPGTAPGRITLGGAVDGRLADSFATGSAEACLRPGRLVFSLFRPVFCLAYVLYPPFRPLSNRVR